MTSSRFRQWASVTAMVVSFLLASATIAAADGEGITFQKKFDRKNAKSYCICTDATNDGAIGHLEAVAKFSGTYPWLVRCVMPTFDDSFNQVGSEYCAGTQFITVR